MLRIKKHGKELTVANSAYRNFYKGAGWQVVGNVSGHKPHEHMAEESDTTDEEWDDAMADEDEEPTKPLSEMNRAELEAMASRLGVSLAGLSTNKQIREAIKASM